jgi:very-short-patch-repair endonuclease
MPRKSEFDSARLNRILHEQHLVISRAQASACGMSRGALQFRIAQSGPWQRLLPGVYLSVTGTVTQDQREMAALLYAGQGSMITGVTAVRRHHLRSPGPDVVDVLIPWRAKRQSVAFVRIHRTRRMPKRLFVTGKIRFTKVPRAVADAARSMSRFDDVRAVVCEAVQCRACTIAELAAELEAGPSAGSAFLREALAEVGDGVRSVAESDFRQLILRSDLPEPIFNAQLFDADGTFIATADAWWEEAGVVAEVDSRAYHLAAKDQDRTNERHDRLIAHGILALHFAPKRMKTDAAGIVREIGQAIEKGLQRPPLPIKWQPPEAETAAHDAASTEDKPSQRGRPSQGEDLAMRKTSGGRRSQRGASSAVRAAATVGWRNS